MRSGGATRQQDRPVAPAGLVMVTEVVLVACYAIATTIVFARPLNEPADAPRAVEWMGVWQGRAPVTALRQAPGAARPPFGKVAPKAGEAERQGRAADHPDYNTSAATTAHCVCAREKRPRQSRRDRLAAAASEPPTTSTRRPPGGNRAENSVTRAPLVTWAPACCHPRYEGDGP